MNSGWQKATTGSQAVGRSGTATTTTASISTSDVGRWVSRDNFGEVASGGEAGNLCSESG